MRVMVLVKATEDSEKGFLPTTEAMEAMHAMGRFNDELRNAGVLVMADGLQPSSQAHCVRWSRPYGHRRAFRRNPRAGGRLLALGSQGHGRGGRLGEALPQPYAGTE